MTGAAEIDRTTLWIVIAGLAVGCYALRFLFIGLVGSRAMPDWLMRHLRYTAVAILPALVAPVAVWPSATGGELDPPRLAASAVTLGVGLTTKNVIAAMLCGAVTLYGLIWLLG